MAARESTSIRPRVIAALALVLLAAGVMPADANVVAYDARSLQYDEPAFRLAIPEGFEPRAMKVRDIRVSYKGPQSSFGIMPLGSILNRAPPPLEEATREYRLAGVKVVSARRETRRWKGVDVHVVVSILEGKQKQVLYSAFVPLDSEGIQLNVAGISGEPHGGRLLDILLAGLEGTPHHLEDDERKGFLIFIGDVLGRRVLLFLGLIAAVGVAWAIRRAARGHRSNV